MRNKSTIIVIPLILLVAFTFIGYFSYLYFTPKSLQIAEISTSGSVALSLSPLDPIMDTSKEQIITLSADSGSDKLTIVKFELTYDPAKLTVSNLTMGTWLTEGLEAPTISNGKISGVIGAKPALNDPTGGAELNRTGSGDLLSFKVKPKVYGTHSISFNNAASEALTMSNISSTPNMLKATSSTQIITKLVADLVGTSHKVDEFDYNAFIFQYNKAGTADFNNSGKVDEYDYNRFLFEYGKTW